MSVIRWIGRGPACWIYYEEKGQIWLQEQWNAYEPPVDFGMGWDDDIKND